MIQKVLSFAKKTLSLAIFMAIAMVFFVSCGKSDEPDTYTVSGYVFDELGSAVEGVEITSEVGSAQTDADGKFVIENVNKGIILKPSKEGYYFPETSKFVISETSDANFTAYEYYDASGVVLKNQKGVANAYVTLTSMVGTFTSVTDEEGKFSATGIAGEAEISCTTDDFEQYFPVKTSISNKNVELNITKTDLTIEFNFDSKGIDFDDISVSINGKKQVITEASPVFEEVKYNSIVTIESDKYVFSRSTFIVEEKSQVESIDVYKIYNVNGVAKSGNTFLSDAEVYLDGEKANCTLDSFGNFSLSGLYGTHKLTVKCGTFEFPVTEITNANGGQTMQFNGTKSVTLDFDFDFGSGEISFDGHEATLLGAGRYKLGGLTLGETVSFSSENYKLSEFEFVVGDENSYTVSAQAYYTATVSVKDGLPATVYLDGIPQNDFSGTFENLYGAHAVTAKLEDYDFFVYWVNYETQTVEIEYDPLYRVTLTVSSGEHLLAGAVATFVQYGTQRRFESNSDGVIAITGLKDTIKITVSCYGYNKTEFEVSEAETKQVNLTFNVTGYVTTKCGTPVEGATVSAGEVTARTDADGFYTLPNLSGKVDVSAEAEYYDFGEAFPEASKQLDINFSGTYTISGVLSGEESIAGYKVCLYDDMTATLAREEYVVEEDGTFIFENLTKTYYLLTKDTNGNFSKLKPNSYNISLGGDGYDFNLSGFTVSGYVTTGEGHPVAGANVYAGSESTKTDEQGHYEFPLLTGETEISVELHGYDFPEKISVSDDKDDANFVGTFSVEGTVKVGDTAVSDVQIFSGESLLGSTDASGKFNISGLSGDAKLEFKKDGYHFDSTVTVSKYETIDVTCKIIVTVRVKTGDVDVSGYKVYVNGSLNADVQGLEQQIIVNYGDTLTFEKTGYEIASETVCEPKTYTVSATYKVSGSVLSGDVAVEGVKVSVNENVVYTDAGGNFTLSGLSGQVSIAFEKDGFEFGEPQSASGYLTDIHALCTYHIGGRVTFNSTSMSGVTVTLQGTEQQITTGDSGEFEFDKISGNFSLSFEKEGYTFDSVANRFGTEQINVSAYFSVSGKVLSGNIGVSGAEIVVSFIGSSRKMEYYQSGANGEFTIQGLSGKVTLVISKDQYTSFQFDVIEDYTTSLSANLKYSVSFSFDTENVDIEASNGKTYKTGSIKTFTTPRELEGEVTFMFKKEHTSFSVNNVKTTQPTEFKNITSSVAYNDVSGRITIKGTSIPVEGITVFAGSESNSVKTDANGYYKFDFGVAGKLGIAEGNFKATILSSIKSDGNQGTYEMPQLDFTIYLYNKAISNLNSAASVQIYGSGEVTTNKGDLAGTQYVKSSFKRDNKGTSVKQNLNYGDPKAGIDPRVALVVVYDSSAGNYKYKKVTGGAIANNYTANYGDLSSTSDRSYFKSTYGAYPEEYSPYILNSETMSITGFKKSGDVFEINISLTGQTNYQKQITQLSPGSKFNNFKSILHTIKIHKDGWIQSLYTDETYNITQYNIPVLGTMDVEVYSKITYTYYTDKPNIKIPDINLNNLQQAIDKAEDIGTISNYAKLDVISNLIGTRR